MSALITDFILILIKYFDISLISDLWDLLFLYLHPYPKILHTQKSEADCKSKIINVIKD